MRRRWHLLLFPAATLATTPVPSLSVTDLCRSIDERSGDRCLRLRGHQYSGGNMCVGTWTIWDDRKNLY
jgi:hypothetical protein